MRFVSDCAKNTEKTKLMKRAQFSNCKALTIVPSSVLRGMMFLVLAILAACLGVTQATYGVDISQPCSSSGFSCLKANGNDFAIVRVFMSTGKVDPNGASSISAAWAGGMAHVDGYIFPCFSCGNPAGQMDAAINGLTAAGLKQVRRLMGTNDTADFKTEELGSSYGMLWVRRI